MLAQFLLGGKLATETTMKLATPKVDVANILQRMLVTSMHRQYSIGSPKAEFLCGY